MRLRWTTSVSDRWEADVFLYLGNVDEPLCPNRRGNLENVGESSQMGLILGSTGCTFWILQFCGITFKLVSISLQNLVWKHVMYIFIWCVLEMDLVSGLCHYCTTGLLPEELFNLYIPVGCLYSNLWPQTEGDSCHRRCFAVLVQWFLLVECVVVGGGRLHKSSRPPTLWEGFIIMWWLEF